MVHVSSFSRHGLIDFSRLFLDGVSICFVFGVCVELFRRKESFLHRHECSSKPGAIHPPRSRVGSSLFFLMHIDGGILGPSNAEAGSPEIRIAGLASQLVSMHCRYQHPVERRQPKRDLT